MLNTKEVTEKIIVGKEGFVYKLDMPATVLNMEVGDRLKIPRELAELTVIRNLAARLNYLGKGRFAVKKGNPMADFCFVERLQ